MSDSWSAFEAAAPELAVEVRARLTLRVHATVATLRADGSPRISGTELRFDRGELWIGSMWQARKALDLLRDPRYALHGGSEDPPHWTGDAKVAGRAEHVTDLEVVAELNADAPPGPSHLFRLGVTEASTVVLAPGGRSIVMTWWTPEGGVRKQERA